VASLRQLPSGNWQASVLLDYGRRSTHTAPTAREAAAWARETEEKRDAEREARRDRSAEQSISLYLAAVEGYAASGQLTPAHLETLRRILDGPLPRAPSRAR
jgi:hypothetical protein